MLTRTGNLGLKMKIKNNYFAKTILLVLCGIFLCTGLSFAKEISFEATVDKNVAQVGSGIEFSLVFTGMRDINVPTLPNIPNFKWRYIGPSTYMSMVNGKVERSVTHAYVIVPEKTGNLTIPSLSIEYNGKAYSSNPIQIRAVTSSSGQGQAQIGDNQAQQRSEKILDDKLFMTINLSKESAYVNEKIHATIKLYISNLSVRDIAFPLIENDAFLVDKFAQPRQYKEALNGVPYNVIDFSTDIYGIYPGQFKLKPTEVSCNVITRSRQNKKRGSSPFDDSFFGSNIFDNFFGQYEKYPVIVKSISVPITVIALPEDGKPQPFNGALGNFNFKLGISPKDVQVGDPITLTFTVTGTGNFNTVNPPSLKATEPFKTYEPEITQESRSKVFKQVVVPRNDKIKQIPPISFSFFNTNTHTYKTITTAAVPITVRPLEKGQELRVFEMSKDSTEKIKRVETFGKDIVYLKENPGIVCRKGALLCKNELLLLLILLPALAVILTIITQARKDYLAQDVRYARSLAAPRKAKHNLVNAHNLLNIKETAKFYDAVFKTLQEYIGDKFHLSTAGISSDVIEKLKKRGVDPSILDELKVCFDTCDRSRYAPSDVEEEEAKRVFKMLKNVISKMGKIKT